MEINRDKLRNLFLMHQDKLTQLVPEFSNDMRHMLNIQPTAQAKTSSEDFAKDLSKKFFHAFNKTEFKQKDQELLEQTDLIKQCMAPPKPNNRSYKKKKKHRLAKLKQETSMSEKIPNKYFCYDCGLHHYKVHRECEHCGEVHKDCCEVH